MGNNKLTDFMMRGGAANNSEYWSDGRVFIKIRKTPYDFPAVLRSA